MKKVYVYSVVFMIVGLCSCKNKPEARVVKPDGDGISVKIEHSAGDNWDASDNFLPLPFNIATTEQDEIIVLSERIKKGQVLDVKAIGAIRVLQNDTLITYVVSVPVNKRFSSFSTSDFDEFSTVYSGAKWIIEQYLLNRKNSNAVKLKSWENENFAINYLLK